MYSSGQPLSYSQRTPVSYNPFTNAPSSVPPAVNGSHYYGATPSQLAGTGTPVSGHIAALDWPLGSPASVYYPSPRHPASAPPYLGAPPAYLAPAANDPSLTPPSLAGDSARDAHALSHPGMPMPSPGNPGPGVPGADLWGLRLLPSPSQVHSRVKKSAARGGQGRKVALVPMSPGEVRDVMGRLGVLLFLDSWRDAVRQWFATDLLASLVEKIRRAPGEVGAPSALFRFLSRVTSWGSSTVGYVTVDKENTQADPSTDPFGPSAMSSESQFAPSTNPHLL